jgi:hypothetical protein
MCHPGRGLAALKMTVHPAPGAITRSGLRFEPAGLAAMDEIPIGLPHLCRPAPLMFHCRNPRERSEA